MRSGLLRQKIGMLDQIRRIVTGCDPPGRSVVARDETLDNRIGSNRRGVAEIWNTDGGPVDSGDARDRVSAPFSLVPQARGTKFIYFTVAPDDPGASSESEEKRAAEAFAAYGAGHARPDTGRNPWMHKTKTVDYIIVLSGRVTLLLDAEERELKPFDVVIQRGTNHAWINRGSEPALLVAVLIDAEVV